MLGIGVVPAQLDDNGKEHVITYASRSNNVAERNYSAYEGEGLAVVWAVTHFQPYIDGHIWPCVPACDRSSTTTLAFNKHKVDKQVGLMGAYIV